MINIKSILALITVALCCVACSSEPVSTSATTYPAQASVGFQQFSKQCSTCHRPPMPNVHTASQWIMVLERMQQHKQQRGLVRMNMQDKEQVLAYLQAHAKKDKP